MKKYLFTLIVLSLFAAKTFAAEGVLFKFDIFQIDNSDNTQHLVYSDSVDVVVGKTITGFVGPFSLDIELLSADSLKSAFNTHIITLSTSAKTYSKSFIAEYELPARMEKIVGKNSSEYLLIISPLSYNPNIDIYCQYDHRVKGDFSVKPTANTEIFYVPSTLSDFYWDSIKELMESNYSLFKNFLNLNIPGKIYIYVPPCPIHSVIWDKRFGTSVDPTRSTAFAVYNKDFITVDPFIINYTAALKTYGYSSPFLSEGLANYFSFAIFDMKKILKEKKNLPLKGMLETYAYYQTDAQITDKTSATFVRFLIDTYSLHNFLELYKKADDINLATTLEDTYKKSVAELEQEWLVYVDTLTIPIQAYAAFASSSEMMLRYGLMHTYNLAYLEHAQTRVDSLHAFSSLKRSTFFNGNYYQAAEYQQKIIDISPVQKAVDWMALGSYSLMVGANDKALSSYKKALAIDSSNNNVKFNLAMYYHINDNSQKAKKILLTNFNTTKSAGTQGETRILLADIFAASKKKSDRSEEHTSELQSH